MNRSFLIRASTLSLVLLLPLALTACGNKGPLVLAEEPTQTPVEPEDAPAPVSDPSAEPAVDAPAEPVDDAPPETPPPLTRGR